MPVSPARVWATRILLDIEEKQAYANLALSRLPKDMPARDRALATELVAGTTRMRRTLDWVLGRFVKRPLGKIQPPVLVIMRMGAYQILFLSRVPARAAVHESVELARNYAHEGAASLVNAVLRHLPNVDLEKLAWPTDPQERIAERFSYPDWIVERWVADYGIEGAEALARAQNEPPPLCLRTNLLRTTRDALLVALNEAGVEAEPSPVAPEGVRLHGAPAVTTLPGYHEGWWYVQGEAAMLAAPALDPQPGEIVADVGAAPGGKTTHLAELMHDKGKVLAVEPHEGRLGMVVDNARRLGLKCIKPLARSVEEALDVKVDRALVDAPCSGLGTLYRKADTRWRMTPQEADALPALQLRMLEAIAPAIKPGGALLYSTCTTLQAENRAVALRFLEGHPEFLPGDLRHALPSEWHADAVGGMIQILPQRHGTEGFFLARFDRGHA